MKEGFKLSTYGIDDRGRGGGNVFNNVGIKCDEVICHLLL